MLLDLGSDDTPVVPEGFYEQTGFMVKRTHDLKDFPVVVSQPDVRLGERSDSHGVDGESGHGVFAGLAAAFPNFLDPFVDAADNSGDR